MSDTVDKGDTADKEWSHYEEKTVKRAERKVENDWSNYEEKVEKHAEHIEQFEEQQTELFPKRKILHKIFILYSGIVGFTAVLLGIGNFLAVFYEDVGTSTNDILRYIISVYLLALTGMAIIVELEWTVLIAESKLLINWVTRGFIYVFIGALSLNQNLLYGTTNPFGESFVNTLSYLMIGCGAGYTIMGVLCLQVLLHKYRFDFKTRSHASSGKHEEAIRDNSVIPPPNDLELT